VSALLGLFLGAPLVAHELEAGTSLFGWTQSVTRKRWFAVKTGWILLAAVYAGAVTALVTWWSVGLGIAAGVVFRRTLPAVAVTVGGFVAVRLLVVYLLRPHYMTPITTTFGLTSPFAPTGSAWVISSGVVGVGAYTGNGPGITIGQENIPIPAGCQGLIGRGPGKILSCIASHGYRQFVTYQPASRFWTFQFIETGIFVALAAVLIGLAAFLLLRDA
jgi:hypothetical protein